MSVAGAVLPVATGLLAAAAVARAVLWTDFGDAQSQATARLHLEPLCVWCLGALAVFAVARSASGHSPIGSLAIAAVLGGAALFVWLAEPAPAPVPDEPREAEPAPSRPAEPAPTERRLWARG